MIILKQYRLTTAHIFYWRPDHLWLLQEYVWQEIDSVPGFPTLRKFLNAWPPAGPIQAVVVANAELPLDDLIRAVDEHMTLQ